MRRSLPCFLLTLSLIFLGLLSLAGCCSDGAMHLSGSVAAASPCAAAASPCGVAAPQMVPVASTVPVGVQYRVGANEYARAGLAVPGALVKCAGTFLECALQALWPIPAPAAYAVPLAAPAAPAAAQPCAPAAAPAAAPCAPAGRWEWRPAVSESAAMECAGGVCTVPGR